MICTTAQVGAANSPATWSCLKERSDFIFKGSLDQTKHTSAVLPDCTVSLH